MASDLVQAVRSTIFRPGLLTENAKVLVAVSGGVDSMVLLRILAELGGHHHLSLTVGHFNHCLRGRRSDLDEVLVRKAAARLKLPFAVARRDVRGYARKKHLSLEMAARECRHHFFARVALKRSITHIALGHHADDQVELFFLRLLRGAGLEGLSGMKVASPSPVNSNLTLIRPLLGASKAEIFDYARQSRVVFRKDASNRRIEFFRNRIRHELLPMLEKHYQPALRRTILRLIQIVQAENEFVSGIARKWLEAKTVGGFDGLETAVQRRCLGLQLKKIGVGQEFELIERLRLAPGLPVTVGSRHDVVRDFDGTVKRGEMGKSGFNLNHKRVDLRGKCGSLDFDGMTASWERLTRGTAQLKPRPESHELFDAEKVGGLAVLRHWRLGDRYQPIGLSGRVKLQDAFCNSKVPSEKRRSVTVATTADGEIFWIEGLRIGERFKVTAKTKALLRWRWARRPG